MLRILLLLFISSIAYGQRPYVYPTIADAASNTYIGIGAYIQTQGYHSSGDGGGALYRMTAIGSAPMAVDSGYVYPVTATKVLVQVLPDEFLNTATYGVVCGDEDEATVNYSRLQRYFNAIDTMDKQAFVNGCNDTIYVAFSSALTANLSSHDKFVMQGEGSDVTRIKASSGTLAFTFSDNSKVSLFDIYLHGYDATAFGGIGGADQSLTYVNDTLTISGGNYVVITGGGGIGTDDQTLSIDSNANTFTLAIESGNSVQFSKTTNTDDQAISLDSTATSYTATVEDGGSITWAKVTDTDTDDQTLSVDSTAYKYTITIADGNAIDFGKSQDNSATNELQTITLDSVSGTYNLSLSNGGGAVKIKRDTDTDDQTLSFTSPNLSISEGNTVDLSALQDGTATDDQTLTIDSNATTYTLSIESGNNVKFAKGGGGGGLEGSGTTDYLARWDADTLTNSVVRDNGATVAIGIGSGGSALTIGQDYAGTNAAHLTIVNTATPSTFSSNRAGLIFKSKNRGNSTVFNRYWRLISSGNTTSTYGKFQIDASADSSSWTTYFSIDTDGGLSLPISSGGEITYRGSATNNINGNSRHKFQPGDGNTWGSTTPGQATVGIYANIVASVASGYEESMLKIYPTLNTLSTGFYRGILIDPTLTAGNWIAMDIKGPSILKGLGTTSATYALLIEDSGGTDLLEVDNSGAVGVGTSSPDATALVDMTSTSRGLLPPRMTETQRNAISTPATGLTIYCTDCTATDASTGVMQTYNGSTWKNHW